MSNPLTRARQTLSKAFSQEDLDLTEGGIGKPLILLSIPIVITNLFQVAYNLADTFWVGRYSTEALAAISFAFPMVFLLISLGLGLSVAGSVMVAQNVGAGNEREAEYAASQTIAFSVVTSVVLGLFGYFVVDDLLAFFGAAPDVYPLAVDYMRVIALGLVFMFGFLMFISLMRGYGDTVTPMVVMFFSVLLNIVLDPFLIFGWWVFPRMGLEGAAYATIFSRALAFVAGLAIMFGGVRGVEIHLGDMKPDADFARRILKIGLPASVEGTGRAVSINLMLLVVGLFPTPVVAAFGIGTRVLSVVFMPAIAMARGVETMSGQNIGADNYDRAAETSWFAAKLLLVVLSLVGLVGWIWAEPIVSVFTTDADVVAVGVTFLRYVAPTFGFMGIMRAYNGSFRGAGKTLTAATISVGVLGVFRLPFAWVAARTLGSEGIWLAFAVSNVLGATVAYLWFQRGTWREADVTHGPGPAPGDD
ncbi:MATE family efflux transporter [Halospeciosus flavus]|uniref:MATE family efflux transporter n=1 Tax=Halospeciosus flavus TaxID=3032283 RepID=A0ABD5Z182_9EURY|nr:MATE family efflux transporter [Halospeciosus flavus]